MTDSETPKSFAEAVATLTKLTKLETAISTAVKNSKVPYTETRKLLKCATVEQASNTALYQFLRELFVQIGLGKLELSKLGSFKYNFIVKNCPICKLYSNIKNRKTCYITSDALTQFFSKGLSLPCNVEETKCYNLGHEFCEFEVNTQPLAVYKIVLDDIDKRLIDLLLKLEHKPEALASKLGVTLEEIKYRLDALRAYHILDEDNKLTEIGFTYHKYGNSLAVEKEEIFAPPWKAMTDITSAISASTSFAEAVNDATEKEPIYEIKDSEVINLAEKARKSKSFAEMLARHLRKEG